MGSGEKREGKGKGSGETGPQVDPTAGVHWITSGVHKRTCTHDQAHFVHTLDVNLTLGTIWMHDNHGGGRGSKDLVDKKGCAKNLPHDIILTLVLWPSKYNGFEVIDILDFQCNGNSQTCQIGMNTN